MTAGPVPQAEAAVTGPIDTDAAEKRWHCHAWPMDADRTGTGSFYIDQNGVILATEDRGRTRPTPSRRVTAVDGS